QRSEAKDSLDDFPTPPWATRALIEHVLRSKGELKRQTCLEPACGAGHMSKVLAEFFGEVKSSDIHDYRYGEVQDFLKKPLAVNSFDWVITNPPFRSAEEFALRAIKVARRGVAILARTVFIESVGRYQRLFMEHPPALFAQFTERVPMVKGRLDLVWIPPCRKSLERDTDYDLPPSPAASAAPLVRKKPKVNKVQESLFG